jgi:hypothetical protein
LPHRQASEQYLTSSRFFAQALRQLIGRPQCAQGLVGTAALLPLKAGADMGDTRIVARESLISSF